MAPRSVRTRQARVVARPTLLLALLIAVVAVLATATDAAATAAAKEKEGGDERHLRASAGARAAFASSSSASQSGAVKADFSISSAINCVKDPGNCLSGLVDSLKSGINCVKNPGNCLDAAFEKFVTSKFIGDAVIGGEILVMPIMKVLFKYIFDPWARHDGANNPAFYHASIITLPVQCPGAQPLYGQSYSWRYHAYTLSTADIASANADALFAVLNSFTVGTPYAYAASTTLRGPSSGPTTNIYELGLLIQDGPATDSKGIKTTLYSLLKAEATNTLTLKRGAINWFLRHLLNEVYGKPALGLDDSYCEKDVKCVIRQTVGCLARSIHYAPADAPPVNGQFYIFFSVSIGGITNPLSPCATFANAVASPDFGQKVWNAAFKPDLKASPSTVSDFVMALGSSYGAPPRALAEEGEEAREDRELAIKKGAIVKVVAAGNVQAASGK